MNFSNLRALSAQAPHRIFIFTVGGCGEFGMNLTVYAYRGQTFIVDCGLAFAEPFELGIDAHIPSPDLLDELLGGPPEAFLITHGHEDHLGALPYFLERWNVPVYIGPWARELLLDKLQQRRDSNSYQIIEVRAGATIQVGLLSVDWIHVPHSIPFCCSLVLQAGPHRIVHTGDFKTQGFLPHDPDLNLAELDTVLKKGPVLALVADSTNAHAVGLCPSEGTVVTELTEVLRQAQGRSIISTFSSNLWRIKTILNIAAELGKRVFIFGAGMRKSVDMGVKLRLLNREVEVLVDEEGLQKLDRKQVIIITSGCQGEHRSGFRRIVSDEVGFLRIDSSDQVIFSSRVIPGNEKSIAKMISLCHQKGARVVTAKEKPGIHVSGHAYAGDLKIFLERLQPRFHIPVHGTFTQMRANQQLAMGPQVVEMINGSVVSLGSDGSEVVAVLELERLFIDSWSRQSMSYDTMRSRLRIGDSGLALVTGSASRRRVRFDLEMIGLPFRNEAEAEACRAALLQRLKQVYGEQNPSQGQEADFNEQARLLVRRMLAERFNKKPVVISKILLIEES